MAQANLNHLASGGKTLQARGERQAGNAGWPAAQGPRPPSSPWGPGGGRGSLSPRVAVGRGTCTRRTRPRALARRGEGGGGRRTSARPCARLRPLKGGTPSTSTSFIFSLSQPLQLVLDPRAPTPRRTCAAERERNKLCSTAQRKEIHPHATAPAHTRAPSPVYITAIQPNLLRPGRAGCWPIPTASSGLLEQQLGIDSGWRRDSWLALTHAYETMKISFP